MKFAHKNHIHCEKKFDLQDLLTAEISEFLQDFHTQRFAYKICSQQIYISHKNQICSHLFTDCALSKLKFLSAIKNLAPLEVYT